MIQRISREAGLDAFIRAIEQDGCVIMLRKPLPLIGRAQTCLWSARSCL
ncbi:hypothetical protein NCS56_01437800 [Fusarium sp. Ph1]|nr:hypothetical protein NCS56_01437800 [Fusarium sp. Ph1]